MRPWPTCSTAEHAQHEEHKATRRTQVYGAQNLARLLAIVSRHVSREFVFDDHKVIDQLNDLATFMVENRRVFFADEYKATVDSPRLDAASSTTFLFSSSSLDHS